MQIILGIISLSCSLAAGIGGMLIGYYKAGASLSKNFISVRDCENCATKGKVADLTKNIGGVTQTLKDGAELFATIRIDIAVIKTKLGIKSDIQELEKMLIELKTRQS
ncbi:MAG: hypothetical protein ABII06_19715 [Pseudomonadota bacterium]